MNKISKLGILILNKIKKSTFLSILPIAVIVFIIGFMAIGFWKSIIIVIILLLIPFFIEYGGKFMEKKNKQKNIIKSKNAVKTEKNGKNARKKRKNKILNIILNIMLIGTIFVMLVCAIFIGYIVKSAPDFNPDNLYKKEASIVYDSKGEIIAKLATEIRDKITYEDMPQVLIDAIIATEDARYNQHNGFDLPRFLKASLGQLMGNSGAGGASTITMQVVKNNFTSTTQTITRKFTDIYMAIFKLERNYSKEQILEFYVNAPYLGANAYGVAEASRNYFDKEVKDLNLAEASLLAGLFQAPGFYDPYFHPDRAEKRRSTVLYLMKRHGYINAEQESIANAVPVESLLTQKQKNKNEYQVFIDTVIDEVTEKTDTSPYSVPMMIYTTLDTAKQDHLNKIMNGETFTWANDIVQSGVAITDNKTGAILALGGGRNLVGERVFNFATMLNKQPGSTAKPLFDYGPGMEYNNWSTYTPFIDDVHTYSNGISIKNWDNKFMGFLTLKQSLGLSRNIPALKAFQQVNNKDIVSFVTSLGIKPEMNSGKIHEAHALGAYNGTNPLQMAAAYAAFGNGGYYIKPYTITKIVYIDTNETKEFKETKNKVMSDSTAYLMTNSLIWAVESGLSSGAKVSGYEVASKTGTTNFDDVTFKNYNLPYGALNDLWTIAYTPDYSIGLWYGYDKINKNYVNSLSDVFRKDKLFGSILKGILPGSNKTFKVPSSVIAVQVERNTIPAMLPSAYTPSNMLITEYFKKGTEPTEVSQRYEKLPNVTGLNVVDSGGKLNISWNQINTPTYYTDEFMQSYFAANYGRQSNSYLYRHKELIATEIGSIGYEVYYKDSNGILNSLGYTSNNAMSIDKIKNEGDITFIVKSAFSIFKSNASDGSEFSFTNKPVAIIEVNINGSSTVTLSIGSPTFVDTNPPIVVLDNFVNVTDKATITSTVITKKSTNTIVTSIDTSSADTYTIKYTAKYKDNNYTATKTVKVE